MRLPRDYVRVHSNDYSVAPGLIGRMIEVTADLDRVHVWHNGFAVTSHERAWARQLTITDPDHVKDSLDTSHSLRASSFQPVMT